MRLAVTDASGAPLGSFFADLPPSAKIAKAIPEDPPKVGSCRSKDVNVLEKLGLFLGIGSAVYANGDCCPNGNCGCLGCGRYVVSYWCGFACDGGTYRYPESSSEPELACSGTKSSDPRNCNGQCECGVSGCYAGSLCGC